MTASLPDLFTTTNLDLAAFLFVRGYWLTEHPLTDGYVTFAFLPTSQLEATVRAFWNNDDVPVQDLLKAQDTCRNIIRQQQQEQRR